MRSLGFLAIFALAGCPNNTINCDDNVDCVQGGIPGTCLASPSSDEHWCAFNDGTCPGGLRWGNAAGDGLARECVNGAEPDASVDAAIDAGVPDARPVPVAKVVAAALSFDRLYVYDPDAQDLITVALPAREQPTNCQMFSANGSLWVTSRDSVVALDPVTLAAREGYPKYFDQATSCNSICYGAVFTDGGMFCRRDASGTADDNVSFFKYQGDQLVFQSALSAPAPAQMESTPTGALAVTGTGIRLFDNAGAASAPIALTIGVSDQLAIGATHFAIGAGKVVTIYDRATHNSVGSHTFESNVTDLVFDDERDHLIVTSAVGKVAALKIADASVDIADVLRSDSTIHDLVVDPARDRIYALVGLAGAQLVMLDAITLDHVAGSPVTLPQSASGLAFH